MKTYWELDVWYSVMYMIVFVYRITGEFPTQEKYGLASQMQRAVVSIAANIAEGYGRLHRGDYIHHLSVSRGSLAELETHIAIAVRLEFLEREKALPIWDMAQDVGKMLTKLIQSLKRQESITPKSSRNTQKESS